MTLKIERLPNGSFFMALTPLWPAQLAGPVLSVNPPLQPGLPDSFGQSVADVCGVDLSNEQGLFKQVSRNYAAVLPF